MYSDLIFVHCENCIKNTVQQNESPSIVSWNVVDRRVRVAEIIRINLGEALNLDDWSRTQLPLISLNVLIREDCCVWLFSHSSFIAAVLRGDRCRQSRRWDRAYSGDRAI